MRRIHRLLGLAALLLAITAAGADHDLAVQDASAAASSWLLEVDRGRYDQSWDDAAVIFQGGVSKASWGERVDAARKPLGAVKTRELHDAQWTSTLPGAPDGEYVVIHFHTVFANKADATETVTPTKGNDGHWHVSGYFVR